MMRIGDCPCEVNWGPPGHYRVAVGTARAFASYDFFAVLHHSSTLEGLIWQ